MRPRYESGESIRNDGELRTATDTSATGVTAQREEVPYQHSIESDAICVLEGSIGWRAAWVFDQLQRDSGHEATSAMGKVYALSC